MTGKFGFSLTSAIREEIRHGRACRVTDQSTAQGLRPGDDLIEGPEHDGVAHILDDDLTATSKTMPLA